MRILGKRSSNGSSATPTAISPGALVNRVWAGYFQRGIIEPPDDLSRANPPCNGPLIDYLTAEFVAHNFDLKWLHRTIACSRTYQLSWRPNETNRFDSRNFSHACPGACRPKWLTTPFAGHGAQHQLDALQLDPNSWHGRLPRQAPKANYALTVFGRRRERFPAIAIAPANQRCCRPCSCKTMEKCSA